MIQLETKCPICGTKHNLIVSLGTLSTKARMAHFTCQKCRATITILYYVMVQIQSVDPK